MTIHLLRHGKTLANEKKLYCGHTDLPLSENGKLELIALKSQNIYPSAADIFFTSGLIRTGQTLDILYGQSENKAASVHLSGGSQDITPHETCAFLQRRTAVPAIAEYNFGQFEMKSYEDLKEQDDYQAWITDETGDVPCPGGESKNQVQKRVMEGYFHITEVMRQAGHKSAIVACHGGTIVSIMEHLFPNTKNFYEWQPQPGRGYSLTYTGDGQCIYNPL